MIFHASCLHRDRSHGLCDGHPFDSRHDEYPPFDSHLCGSHLCGSHHGGGHLGAEKFVNNSEPRIEFPHVSITAVSIAILKVVKAAVVSRTGSLEPVVAHVRALLATRPCAIRKLDFDAAALNFSTVKTCAKGEAEQVRVGGGTVGGRGHLEYTLQRRSQSPS